MSINIVPKRHDTMQLSILFENVYLNFKMLDMPNQSDISGGFNFRSAIVFSSGSI